MILLAVEILGFDSEGAHVLARFSEALDRDAKPGDVMDRLTGMAIDECQEHGL